MHAWLGDYGNLCGAEAAAEIGLWSFAGRKSGYILRERTFQKASSGWPFWSGHASVPGITTASNDRGFRFRAEIIKTARYSISWCQAVISQASGEAARVKPDPNPLRSIGV